MTDSSTLWMYFWDASLVVKTVMLCLLSASIVSWTIIIARYRLFAQLRAQDARFEQYFWSGHELSTLHEQSSRHPAGLLAPVFNAGYDELLKIKQQHGASGAFQSGVTRAMRVAIMRQIDKLELPMGILASIGSVSPYVGLFGTVWGIMASLHALGNVQQASVAMVAPGISEALVATAMGLFAAIPAVLAYNRFTQQITRFEQSMFNFQDEFINIIERQLPAK